MAAQQPIQGQVQYTEPPMTFGEVLAQDPKIAPADKQSLADAYFKKYYSGLPDNDQQALRVEFNKKYNVGQLIEAQPAANAFEQAINTATRGLTTAGLGVSGVLDPAISAFSFNTTNPNALADMAAQNYPGIATDPGAMGDAYRFATNPWTNAVGGALGAFGGMRNVAGALPSLGSMARNAMAAVGTYTGLGNIAPVVRGEQSLPGAIADTALSTLTAPLGFGNRLANAGIQGGLNYGQVQVQRGINNQPFDPLNADAIRSAAIGAGMGFGMPSPPRQALQGRVEATPRYQGRPVVRMSPALAEALPAQQAPGLVGRILGQRQAPQRLSNVQPIAVVREAQQVRQALTSQLRDAQSVTGITEKKALQGRIRALEKAYNTATAIGQSPNAQTATAAQEVAQAIRKAWEQATAEYSRLYPDSKTAKAATEKRITSKEQLQRIVQAGIKYRKQGGELATRFNQTLQGYAKVDRDRVNALIKQHTQGDKQQAQATAERAQIRREIGKTKVKGIAEARKAEVAKQTAEARAEKARQDALLAQEREKQKLEAQAQKSRDAINAARRKQAVKNITSDNVSAEEKAGIRQQFVERYPAPKKPDTSGETLLQAIVSATEATRQKPKANADLQGKSTGPDMYARMARDAGVKGEPKEATPRQAPAEKPPPEVPRVLEEDEIEAKAQELLAHAQKNERGQFDAKKAAIQKAARTDYTKGGGATPERAQAINLSHQRIIDRYTQLKAEAQEQAKVAKAKEKADAKAAKTAEQSQVETKASIKKARDAGYEPTQSREGMSRLIQRAKKTNTVALIEYEAQGGESGVGGESVNANYRFKRDTIIEGPADNAKGVTQIKVINNEGQVRTRLFNEPTSGSRIVSVTRTDEPAPYRYEYGKVYDVATGAEVAQIDVEGIFSKDIQARIENIERVLTKYRAKTARVSDIMEAGKPLPDNNLTKVYTGDMKKDAVELRQDIHKTTTGEDCS